MANRCDAPRSGKADQREMALGGGRNVENIGPLALEHRAGFGIDRRHAEAFRIGARLRLVAIAGRDEIHFCDGGPGLVVELAEIAGPDHCDL